MSEEIKYPEGATKVLDYGFVRLVDVMGDDSSIVQAARVSYGKGTKKVNQDYGLIRYLMRHGHTTPFEMVEFKFHCRMPIFIARQWIRHRTASVNEYSARYSEIPDVFYLPDEEQCTIQSTGNRQGTANQITEHPKDVRGGINLLNRALYEVYRMLLKQGLRRELARIILPVSVYTEWYWKIDLHNLFHFLQLRLDSHAQYEIRVFAQVMATLIQPYVPIAWQAFEDYRLNATNFTGPEMEFLSEQLECFGISEEKVDKIFTNTRERAEFKDKLVKLGAELT